MSRQVWHWGGVVALCLAVLCPTRAQDEDIGSASLDELLFQAQRYGSTEAKREGKLAAREELRARRAPALAFLMSRMHVDNYWIYALSEQLVRELDSDESAPVLLEAVGSEQERTRKMAVFFLGMIDTPRYADRVVPLLEDDAAAGAAVRTLGKWHLTNAVGRIVGFLDDPDERRRVLAANALRDIGSADAVPRLVAALDDPMFTVRKTVARALAALGAPAEAAILAALPGADRRVEREMLRVLGEVGSDRSLPALRQRAEAADPMVRRDAASALEAIAARERE